MKNQFSFFLLTFFLLSSSVLAVEEDKETEALEPVVVTATKIPTPISQLGASVEVITEEEIKKSGTKDVLEVLRSVAGFNIVQSGGKGGTASLFVRGGESDFNLVLIDGVQVNDIGGSFDFSRLTTDNIERIEIVKGSHSAIYGSDAVTSVINIITKKGKGKPSLDLSTALGAHKEKDGSLIQEYHASLSGGRSNFGYSLGYGRIDDNGILINNEYTNNTFSGAFNYNPLDILSILFTARYEDSRFEFPTESAGDRFDPLDPDQFDVVESLTFGANVSFSPTPWWEHILLIGLHDRDFFFRDNPNPDVTFFDSDQPSTTSTDETRFSLDYRWNFYYDVPNTVNSISTLGFEYENEAADQSSVSSFGASAFDESRDNLAFYLQEQIGFFERLFITGGLRVDHNENFGTEVSPRGSIAYLIKETGTKLRGGIGRGIKEPTIIENFGLGTFTVGNPDLKPEESITWEVGLDQKLFGEIVEINFTYFWNKFDNLIVFSFAPFPNGTNFENIQEAKTNGIELGGTLRPLDGLTIKGNYTLLDTEVTDDGGLGSIGFSEDESLIRRPKHSFSFLANYFYGGFNLNLKGIYVGKRGDLDFSDFINFTTNRVTLDDYFRLDLAGYYEIPVSFLHLKEVRIFTRIENLLNEDYEEVFGFSAEEFNFIVGLSFRI
ncbi:MAG: TonB-dependent receptor [Deltaproteobacteria bacterium]|nr:TonB-dependent receptor [Deltaproteobacteria bacterium]